jgi:hypothetical protein
MSLHDTTPIGDDHWIGNETLRADVFRLHRLQHRSAQWKFPVENLERYTEGTQVLACHDGRQLVAAVAVSQVFNRHTLASQFRLDVQALECAMVGRVYTTLRNIALADAQQAQQARRHAELYVDPRAIDRLALANPSIDDLGGLGARLQFPMLAVARAVVAPGHEHCLRAMQCSVLELARRSRMQAVLCLNAGRPGLVEDQVRQPVETYELGGPSALHEGLRSVSLVQAGSFKAVYDITWRLQRGGKLPRTRWDRTTGQALALMPGRPW